MGTPMLLDKGNHVTFVLHTLNCFAVAKCITATFIRYNESQVLRSVMSCFITNMCQHNIKEWWLRGLMFGKILRFHKHNIKERWLRGFPIENVWQNFTAS